VLAAGAATRFGSPKQALLLPGILERVRLSGVDEIVVVEGAYPLSPLPADIRLVRCPDWELGGGASLRTGLRALDEGVEAAVIVLADGPHLAPEAIGRVVEHWRATGAPVVAASYAGTRGHPVLAARTAWAAVPDEGLRAVAATLVPCDDLGAPGDVDRPEDLPSPPPVG
jgi:CTP:molybdopterin cytidylyltransferase MocA